MNETFIQSTSQSIFEPPKYSGERKPNILFTLIDEPKLGFGQCGKHEDPKEGIRTFGPYSYGSTTHPKEIKIGFIGTGETAALAKNWCIECSASINSKRDSKLYHLFQDFAGFNEIFRSNFIFNEHWNQQVNKNEIDELIKIPNKADGFNKALELLAKKVEKISQQDSKPDVIIVSLPQEIEDYYKTVGKVFADEKIKLTSSEKRFRDKLIQLRNQGQKNLLGLLVEPIDSEKNVVYKNFRRAFKGQVMKYNIPTQILLSSKLKNNNKIQDSATRAWNFCTAIYYKAGGIPWNMEIEKNTCFVGISFYRHITETSFTTHTSLAQVFTDKGDFLILRGSDFEWDPNQGKSPHLTYDGAKDLIKQVLEKYKENTGNLPSRVVVHKTSKYWPEELKGFLEPLKDVEQYDLVALYSTGIKFFRSGDYPVLRGTYCSISDQAHFIFTQGYVPYLETYPRSYVPEPLEIIEHIGDSTKKKICGEIIALSKMNWNNSDFANKLPITLSFAQKVGEILSHIPRKAEPHPSYKFYM